MKEAQESSRATLADRKNDTYETPPVAVEALLQWETLPHYLWEPACGRGNIVNVLRAAGHEVLASDLVDHGDPTHFYRRDFLMEQKAPDRCKAIVTNPPFKLAEKFISHGLKLCPTVCVLLRLQFLEGQRPSGIMDSLLRVFVFTNRLPMMHREGWTGRKVTSRMCFAWFIFDRRYPGSGTELYRIRWEP